MRRQLGGGEGSVFLLMSLQGFFSKCHLAACAGWGQRLRAGVALVRQGLMGSGENGFLSTQEKGRRLISHHICEPFPRRRRGLTPREARASRLRPLRAASATSLIQECFVWLQQPAQRGGGGGEGGVRVLLCLLRGSPPPSVSGP